MDCTDGLFEKTPFSLKDFDLKFCFRAVHRAINRLTIPDYNASTAVDVRQELDLRIGAAFTRFQTLRLRRVFPQALSDQLISYGSCQFPTLGFVVERFREVDQFVSEPFWRIVGKLLLNLRSYVIFDKM